MTNPEDARRVESGFAQPFTTFLQELDEWKTSAAQEAAVAMAGFCTVYQARVYTGTVEDRPTTVCMLRPKNLGGVMRVMINTIVDPISDTDPEALQQVEIGDYYYNMDNGYVAARFTTAPHKTELELEADAELYREWEAANKDRIANGQIRFGELLPSILWRPSSVTGPIMVYDKEDTGIFVVQTGAAYEQKANAVVARYSCNDPMLHDGLAKTADIVGNLELVKPTMVVPQISR